MFEKRFVVGLLPRVRSGLPPPEVTLIARDVQAYWLTGSEFEDVLSRNERVIVSDETGSAVGRGGALILD